MTVLYISDVSDRREFRLARIEAGMTGHDVDAAAGYGRGTCANFENNHNNLSEIEELRLLDFLQALVAFEVAKRDYKAAYLAYLEKHEICRNVFSKRSGVTYNVLKALESDTIKSRMHAETRAKLDAILFAD